MRPPTKHVWFLVSPRGGMLNVAGPWEVLGHANDILGREVQTLVNEVKQPGRYEAVLNGNNLASGVYLYRLQAGSFTQTRRLCLLK